MPGRKAMLAGLAVAGSLAMASSAGAATLEVNALSDDGTGICELREAVVAINGDADQGGCVSTGGDYSGIDTINFHSSITGGATIDLTGGQLQIDRGMNINGPGSDQLILSAGPSSRLLGIGSFVPPVTVSGLNLEDGVDASPGPKGGAIYTQGLSLSLTDVIVSGNTITGTSAAAGDVTAHGAAIYSEIGSLTIEDTEVTGNTATATNSLNDDFDSIVQGGAIYHSGLPLTIRNSTIAGNTAVSTDQFGPNFNQAFARVTGGAIYSASSGFTATQSTISGNTVTASSQGNGKAEILGGGLFVGGSSSLELVTLAGNASTANGIGSVTGGGLATTSAAVAFRSSTIAGNNVSAGFLQGANLYVETPGSVQLKNTIVADGNASNCSGVAVSSAGHNLDDGTSCGLDPGNDPTDKEGVDPELGPLQDNGGPTSTMAPGAGPATDAGDSTGQTIAGEDQRGLTRPMDSSGFPNVGDGSDIGAWEAQAPATPTVTATDPASPSNTQPNPKVQGVVSDDGTVEGATTVSIYTDSSCSDQVNANSPSTFEGAGINGSSVSNTTRTFYAQTSNDYGLVSPCSSTLGSNASVTYTHDSIAPAAQIDSGPTDPSDHTPSFTFSATDANAPLAFACSADAGTASFAACASPFTAPTLADGGYTFRVTATDPAGNESVPATQAFSITTPATKTGKRAAALKKCKKKPKKKRKKCRKRAQRLPV